MGPSRLLVVDDDTVHRMVICRVGRQAGFEVDEAASFDDARAALIFKKYHCVALDLALGQQGGIDVMRVLAEVDSTAPLVLISGAGETIRNTALAAATTLGIVVYESFAKPVDLGALRASLTHVRRSWDIGLFSAAS